MKETSEEVNLGDTLILEFTKEVKGRIKHHHYECHLIPELIPLLLEHGIIEEKEVDEEVTAEEIIKELIKAHEELELKVEELEKQVKYLLLQLHNTCNKKNAKKGCRE